MASIAGNDWSAPSLEIHPRDARDTEMLRHIEATSSGCVRILLRVAAPRPHSPTERLRRFIPMW